MFYFKLAVLAFVIALTLVQLFGVGAHFLEGMSRRKTDFVRTSTVQGSVVEVVTPTPDEEARNKGAVPGYYGKAVVEYRDPSGALQREEFPRINSGGRTVYFDKKVGDAVTLEVKSPETGSTSSQEKAFWAHLSKILLIFAAALAVAAVVLRVI